MKRFLARHALLSRVPRAYHVQLQRACLASRLTQASTSTSNPAYSTAVSETPSEPQPQPQPHVAEPVEPSVQHQTAADASVPTAAAGGRVYTRDENLKDARRVACEVLGIEELRPEQENVILQILAGEDVLVAWPINSGRSLCYLVPALVESQRCAHPGLTVVMSPSESNCEVRANALNAKGIRAAVNRAGASGEQKRQVDASIRNGSLRILFTSTDYYGDSSFAWMKDVLRCPGGVRQVVIDEADHLSKLSSSYRAGYEVIPPFLDKLKPKVRLCQTRNAPAECIEDLCRLYKIKNSLVSRLAKLPPANVELSVVAVNRLHDKYAAIIKILARDKRRGRTIIHLASDHENFTNKLQRDRHDATTLTFVSKTESSRRSERLLPEDELARRKRHHIYCITKMGLSYLGKASDETQLHHGIFQHLPKTDYFLEMANLVGRDGEFSRCTLILSGEEVTQRETNDHAQRVGVFTLKSLLRVIFDGARVKPTSKDAHDAKYIVAVDLAQPSVQFQIPRNMVWNILDFLDQEGFLRWRQAASIVILCRYTISGPLPNTRLAKHLQASYDALRGVFNLVDYSESSGDDLRKVWGDLKGLQRTGSLQVGFVESASLLEILKDDITDDDIEALARSYFTRIAFEQQIKADSLKRFLDIFGASECITAALAKYLDTQLPKGKTKCGHCSACKHGPAGIPNWTPPPPDEVMIRRVTEAYPMFASDPRALARVALGLIPVTIPSAMLIDPKINSLKRKMQRRGNPLFGCLGPCRYQDVLEAFAEKLGIPRKQWADC